MWGETWRAHWAHCHLPGFTRILLITICNKAKSQYYPEVQRCTYKVKTRRKYFYARGFGGKWLSCFQNQLISIQNTTQESTHIILGVTLLRVHRKCKFTNGCKSSTGKDFLPAIPGNGILK